MKGDKCPFHSDCCLLWQMSYYKQRSAKVVRGVIDIAGAVIGLLPEATPGRHGTRVGLGCDILCIYVRCNVM